MRMDCNREEATRAKEMAEELMKKTDYNGARRLALRAQKLYSELENISQMLMVCDVHCAAGIKSSGNDMNWYHILQIEETANDVTIKKQYRKFALLLHPDKNYFPGAEAAFKLIGEAQRTLLDRDKRSLYDMKCKAYVNRSANPAIYRPQQVPNYYASTSVQNHNLRNSFFTGWRPNNQRPEQQTEHRPQSALPKDRQTFWTSCPFCYTRYEYYKEIINSFINCQKCGKQFTAYEISAQGAAPATKSNQTAFHFTQQRNVPGKVCTDKFATEKVGEKRKKMVESSDSFESESSSESEDDIVICENGETEAGIKVGEKRKKMVESSDSFESESSSESEDDIVICENGETEAGIKVGSSVDQQPRRSGRTKRQVSYNENLSDDDQIVANGSEKSTQNGKAKQEKASDSESRSDADNTSVETLPTDTMDSDKMYVKENDDVGVSKRNSSAHSDIKTFEVHIIETDSGSEGEIEPKTYDCPDPEFNDFDKLRQEGCFKAGQFWAVYDIENGMPRFYAQITRVFHPGFKLRIRWLEPDPDEQNEIKWHKVKLPVSCGRYRLGTSEKTEDHLMFSHLIHCENGSMRDQYKIYPRKGESWALFKNWSIEWFSDPDSHRNFEYEFVEVMSDYAEREGIFVAYLHKVKGFTSVFCRMVKEETDAFHIPSREKFRFSHRVPSFKLTGLERNDAPKGYFELDPASLSANIEEVSPLDAVMVSSDESETGDSLDESEIGNSSDESEAENSSDESETENSSDESETGNCSSPGLKSDGIVIPEAEFFNFDADKSKERFQIRQVWSLYNDGEGLPKYYARIKKIECKPIFRLSISWLESCILPDNVIRWRDKQMPICCGTFKVKKGRPETYSSLNTFSHELRVESALRRDEYLIYPKNGDVWAVYRNWSNKIKYADLEKCEYDVVEIIDKNDTNIEVWFLERVGGFNSVFKGAMKEGSPVKMVIPGKELLRFSHQVPAFRLTDERGGGLRGFVELDPAALPLSYFGKEP